MEAPGRTSIVDEPLRISTIADANLLVVELEGEIDIDTVPALQAGMDAIDAERADDVVIDLGGVSFLSPHALSVLVRCAHRLERRSRWVEFRRPSVQVRRMLEWTGGPLRLSTD